MKATVTNATIYDTIAAINKFATAKGKTAFVLFRALRKLQDEIKDCDEQKNTLIKKYGKEIDGGIGIEPEDKDAYEGFLKEFTPILFYELEVDLPQMTEEDFNSLYEVDAKEAGINDYALIEALLVEKPEPEKKKEKAEKVEGEVVDKTE